MPQGFGKRKNLVGMARPKKQKVEVAKTAETSPIIEEDTAGTGARQVSPALSSSPPAPDASPGRAQCDKAVDDYIVLKKVREALEATAQDASEKLKVAKRLFEAKKRRSEAPKNHRGERKLRKPFRVACRMYEAIIELNHAQLRCAWAETAAAKASHAVACCLVHAERLECERLRRRMG